VIQYLSHNTHNAVSSSFFKRSKSIFGARLLSKSNPEITKENGNDTHLVVKFDCGLCSGLRRQSGNVFVIKYDNAKANIHRKANIVSNIKEVCNEAIAGGFTWEDFVGAAIRNF